MKRTMKRDKLKIGIGLFTEHVSLKGHLYKLRLAEQKECKLCGEKSKDSLHILCCHCSAFSCKRYRFWGRMFLEPEDLAIKR